MDRGAFRPATSFRGRYRSVGGVILPDLVGDDTGMSLGRDRPDLALLEFDDDQWT